MLSNKFNGTLALGTINELPVSKHLLVYNDEHRCVGTWKNMGAYYFTYPEGRIAPSETSMPLN